MEQGLESYREKKKIGLPIINFQPLSQRTHRHLLRHGRSSLQDEHSKHRRRLPDRRVEWRHSHSQILCFAVSIGKSPSISKLGYDTATAKRNKEETSAFVSSKLHHNWPLPPLRVPSRHPLTRVYQRRIWKRRTRHGDSLNTIKPRMWCYIKQKVESHKSASLKNRFIVLKIGMLIFQSR